MLSRDNVHKFALENNIKHITLIFDEGEVVHYYKLSDKEYQVYHEGDCPGNYIYNGTV